MIYVKDYDLTKSISSILLRCSKTFSKSFLEDEDTSKALLVFQDPDYPNGEPLFGYEEEFRRPTASPGEIVKQFQRLPKAIRGIAKVMEAKGWADEALLDEEERNVYHTYLGDPHYQVVDADAFIAYRKSKYPSDEQEEQSLDGALPRFTEADEQAVQRKSELFIGPNRPCAYEMIRYCHLLLAAELFDAPTEVKNKITLNLFILYLLREYIVVPVYLEKKRRREAAKHDH